MSILLHKPYLVKVTTKGGGGSKISKNLTTWFLINDFKTKELKYDLIVCLFKH